MDIATITSAMLKVYFVAAVYIVHLRALANFASCCVWNYRMVEIHGL